MNSVESSNETAPLGVENPDTAAEIFEEDSLVEEVSIDGMCGVY